MWFRRQFCRAHGRTILSQELQVIYLERVHSSRVGSRYWEVPSALLGRTLGSSGLRELSSRCLDTGYFQDDSVRYILSSELLTSPYGLSASGAYFWSYSAHSPI